MTTCFTPNNCFETVVSQHRGIVSGIPGRRAITSQHSRTINEANIVELIIENTQGGKIYDIIEILLKIFETTPNQLNKENYIFEESIQLVGLIEKYVNYFYNENTSNSVEIIIRLNYLIICMLEDLIHFIEIIMDCYTYHNWNNCYSLSLSLLGLKSLIIPLIHIENVLDSLTSLQFNFPLQHRKNNNLSVPTHPTTSVINSSINFIPSTSLTPQKEFFKPKFNRVQSECLTKSTHSNTILIEDIISQYKILNTICIEKPSDWKNSLETCKKTLEGKLILNGMSKYQKSYDDYSIKMSKIAHIYYCGYCSNPEYYSRSYSWLPLLYGLTKEDFFGALIHLIKEDNKRLLSVGFLLEHWRKVPRAFESKFMNMMYKIFINIEKIHKRSNSTTSLVLSMKEEYELPIFKRCIWRYPPQYFYILLNPRFVAQKLTEAHVGIFTKCPPRAIFYSKQMRRAGIGATDLKKKVDILAYWVSQSLYESVQNPLLNKEFHEYFIEIISQLYWLRHNLLATLGLSIGFSSFRLNKFEKPILRNDMTKLRNWVNELTDPKDGSYPNLITAMKELGNPCIPYFGSFQNIFEKVLSADIQDVGVLYLNIGKATEETRRNRIKWSDLIYEDSTYVNSAFEISFNEWCETPWSDSKLFDSMVKSTKFRVLHKNQDIPRRKKCIINLKKTKNGFMVQPTSICRYTKYSPLL
ncbi:hypothetical protein CL6EHI_030490 [Entamoeba histolytica]|uniref:Uncharacterized protein n=2 Tax=Entamoeba histolytica TaxID=5759 RepID=C4M460_ENTH1|nr:hypothetical protein EHI_030490 [Entamoeba histolytica HM-1:IMSS]EAL44424.1 hypothetical protein EHI_030490 [Entamoeba histolytica HM-1:IMSS]GAT96139.1 hypothetical protein CL6EHI_030490 [Entamoeba histolytica]|eukprot:XP_649810.1 hypothetical protein EHI_030490 [Entamoeba histolytica HM-1:IMSS]